MPLSADLDAAFGGLDLSTAFGELSGLFGGVDLPSLDLSVSVSVSVDGIGTDSIAGSLSSVFGGLAELGLPDIEGLLGPLTAALRLPELVAAIDVEALRADLVAAIAPAAPGLGPLVDATLAVGTVPTIGALADLLAPLGLDVRVPGGLLGGAAGGAVALASLFGALLTVEATSRALDQRAQLVAQVLGAERLGGLIARVRAAGGATLAGLLVGIDPDDPELVELIARPIEEYVALVAEVMDALVRGLAFAEATVADADVTAQVTALAVASALLVESAVGPVRELVATLAPLTQPLVDLDVPVGGADVVFGAAATMGEQLAGVVDGLPVETIGALAGQALDPVLSPLRAVERALDELQALIGVVFDPLRAGLAAIDLGAVAAAIERVAAPIGAVIDTVTGAIEGAQADIESVVDAVHDALTPVRTQVTSVAATLTAPFASVQELLGGLDLAELQADVESVVGQVQAAIEAAPVQPVFDVATGIIDVAAGALGLVPKAMLPDDLRRELEAACAPVESLDLEPTRIELHEQLAAMVASLDASALDAVAQGLQAVRDFLADIDPRPHVTALETDSFAALSGALDQLDPATLLAPVLDVLVEARAALAGLDVGAVLAPIDDALDDVAATIATLDPTELLAPVEDVLATATGTVREALHLAELTAQLDALEAGAAGFIERLPVTDLLDAVEGAWAGLVSELRGNDDDLGGGVLRGLLGGLLPGVDVGGVPEVIAWMRGERDGTVVVHDRLARASATMSAAHASLATLDFGALITELDGAHRQLAGAVAALPEASRLRQRLAGPVSATRPGPDLGLVAVNEGAVTAALEAASTALASTTPADRTEVQRTAASLGAAFTPFTPAGEAVTRLGGFVGLDPDVLLGRGGLRLAVAGLAEQLGPGPLLGPLRAVITRLEARANDFLVATLAPLREAVATVDGIFDALSVSAITEPLDAVLADLQALVDGVRPSVVLAAPLAVLEDLRTTLTDFDPLGPVTTVVEAMRAEVDAFTTDLAPTRLLAPVLDLYDDVVATVGSFDPAGLLEPVLHVLESLQQIIDRGIDDVIESLAKLQSACESEGGALPGLDLSIAASVDLGGGFGL